MINLNTNIGQKQFRIRLPIQQILFCFSFLFILFLMYLIFNEVSYLDGTSEKLLTEIDTVDKNLDQFIHQNQLDHLVHDPTLVHINSEETDYEEYNEIDHKFHKIKNDVLNRFSRRAEKLAKKLDDVGLKTASKHIESFGKVFGGAASGKSRKSVENLADFLNSEEDETGSDADSATSKTAETLKSDLNSPPIYPLQFTFKTTPEESCKTKDLILVIISDLYNFSHRDVIRKSYCSKHYLPTTFSKKFACMFVIASSGNAGEYSWNHEDLENEILEHKDILIPNVPEKNTLYFNILSVISAIYHIAQDCETTYTTHQNVVFITDMTFVNLPKFLLLLAESRLKSSTQIIGTLKPAGEPVIRNLEEDEEDAVVQIQSSDKNDLEKHHKIIKEVYEPDFWPEYYDTINGAGLLLSYDIIQLISKIYHKVKIIPTRNFGKYLSIILEYQKSKGTGLSHLKPNEIELKSETASNKHSASEKDLLQDNDHFGRFIFGKAEFDLLHSAAKVNFAGLGFEELGKSKMHKEFCKYIRDEFLIPVGDVTDFDILFKGFERCQIIG